MINISIESFTRLKDKVETLINDNTMTLSQCETFLDYIKELQLAIEKNGECFEPAEKIKVELLLVFTECLLEIHSSAIMEATYYEKKVKA